MAAETLSQALSYIDELLPNKVASTTKITLINNELRRLWPYMTSTEIYEFVTVSSQYVYSLPSDCEFESIVENGLAIGDSTATATSTTVFTTYSFAGDDEELTDYHYYNVSGSLGIYPAPEYSDYPARLKYQKRPTLFASSDTNSQFDVEEDFVDVIKLRTMSKVAKCGNNPDVELANNYDADADQLERKLKMRTLKKRSKTPRTRWSYREGWNV